MDKKLRNVIIFGIIITSLSIGYYLALKPATKTEFGACYEQCNKDGFNGGGKACVSLCGRKTSN